MSIYNGILPYTPIVVDNFRIVSGVSIFFLTHFHADHYGGLSARFNAGPIYCSEVTRDLVLNKFKINPELITGLDVGSTYTLNLVPINSSNSQKGDSDQLNRSIDTTPKDSPASPECTVVNVTLFPSDHCPGSVMILFESYFGRYLHTGDFRYNAALASLYAPIIRTPVDRLFLDATFAAPFWDLPKRSEAIDQIIALIEQQPSGCEVFLECTMLGCEEIYKRLWQRFKKKIHLDPEKCEEFLCAPDLDHVLTTVASETPLHVCRSGTFVLLSEDSETIQRFNVKRTELRKLSTEERDEEDSSVAARKLEMASLIRQCQTDKRPYVLIKPSTQWFGQQQMDSSTTLNARPVKDCYGIWHVLYSIHSSHKEIVDFLKLIQPLHITPITECDRHVLKILHQFIHKDVALLRKSSVTVPVKIAQLMRQARKSLPGHKEMKFQPKSATDSDESNNINRRLSLEERSANAYGFMKQSFVGKKRKFMNDENEKTSDDWTVRKRQKIDEKLHSNFTGEEKDVKEHENKNDSDGETDINNMNVEQEEKEADDDIIHEIRSFQQKDKFNETLQLIENDKSGEIKNENNNRDCENDSDEGTIRVTSSGELILEYKIDDDEVLLEKVDAEKNDGKNINFNTTPEKESQKSEIDENERMMNDLLGSDNDSSIKKDSNIEILFKPIERMNDLTSGSDLTQISNNSSGNKATVNNSGHNSSFDEENLFSQVANEEKIDENPTDFNFGAKISTHNDGSNDKDFNIFEEVLKEKEEVESKQLDSGHQDSVKSTGKKSKQKRSTDTGLNQMLKTLFQPTPNLKKIPKAHVNNNKL